MSELCAKNQEKLNSKMKVSIDLQDSENIDIVFNLTIKEFLNRKEIIQNNSQILFDLENNEVFYINLCIE